jgi:hypothetical protein
VLIKKYDLKKRGLPVVHDHAAGIDIGSRFHVVVVPAYLAKESVQTLQAFTSDLERLANWLVIFTLRRDCCTSGSICPIRAEKMPRISTVMAQGASLAMSSSALQECRDNLAPKKLAAGRKAILHPECGLKCGLAGFFETTETKKP